ncbi:hypothetical protein E2C01_035868 [Portunus trituberculatus]|uniref:Uncharacterized protein n=1 Tax=Portunus trituberculatus TaxID=210409 RepID=A0A5B7F740_PORTR|nr:hypothetical protein [Portunus trituberculatus]
MEQTIATVDTSREPSLRLPPPLNPPEPVEVPEDPMLAKEEAVEDDVIPEVFDSLDSGPISPSPSLDWTHGSKALPLTVTEVTQFKVTDLLVTYAGHTGPHQGTTTFSVLNWHHSRHIPSILQFLNDVLYTSIILLTQVMVSGE